ncbi:MAG: DUF4339 domain-containing protein [Opitutales bacterium]
MQDPQQQWFVVIDQEQRGPTTFDGILTYFQTGRADRTSLVWQAGMAEWKPLGEIPEFQRFTRPSSVPAFTYTPSSEEAAGDAKPVDWVTRLLVTLAILVGLSMIGGLAWLFDYYGNQRYEAPAAANYRPPDAEWVRDYYLLSGQEIVSPNNIERAKAGNWVPLYDGNLLLPTDMRLFQDDEPVYGLKVPVFEVEELEPETVTGAFIVPDGTEMLRWRVRRQIIRRPAAGARAVGVPPEEDETFVVYACTQETDNGVPFTVTYTDPAVGALGTEDVPITENGMPGLGGL